jgi:predicted dehydrogenase
MSQSTLTRRQFLGRTTLTTLALTAPSIVPSTVLGRGAEPAPSNKINFALIGAGSMGRGDTAQMLYTGQTRLRALCDVDATQSDAAWRGLTKYYQDKGLAGQHREIRIYKDYREVLARKDIDAVVIATPDHWHALPAIAAARAGKDIYCEKPLSLTIREARAMVNAVRQNKRVFQTGSQQRSSSVFRRAAEMVLNGYLGHVHTIYVRVGGTSKPCDLGSQPVPEGLDWDMWLGQAPIRGFNSQIHPRKWRAYREYSGGTLTDWGAHHFDIVQWALGMDNSGPVEVTPPGPGQPLLCVRYANGTRAYHVNGPGAASVKWPGPPPPDGNVITFVGEKGWIEVDRQHIKLVPEALEDVTLKPSDRALTRSPGHHNDFVQCIRSRKLPICDVEIGCRSITVCHLANIAYWTNSTVRWDAAKEEIIGNPLASKWLQREQRAPYKIT